MSFFKPRQSDLTDNTSVNIVEFGDRLYAMTETPLMLQVDPETLQKKGTRVSLEPIYGPGIPFLFLRALMHVYRMHGRAQLSPLLWRAGTIFFPRKFWL